MRCAIACVALLLFGAAQAVPNWDLSNTTWQLNYKYTYSSDPDGEYGGVGGFTGAELSFGSQDAAGNVAVKMRIPLAQFADDCATTVNAELKGVVNGDTVSIYPVSSSTSYGFFLSCTDPSCFAGGHAMDVTLAISLHLGANGLIDSGTGTIHDNLDLTSFTCGINWPTGYQFDLDSFSGTGGPAKRKVSLSGKTTLDNFAGNPATRPLTLDLTGPTNQTIGLAMDSGGNWSTQTALAPGSYTLLFGVDYYLRGKLDRNITGNSSGLDVDLLGGDAAPNNAVDVHDLTEIFIHYAESSPDVDGNGIVDLKDLNIVFGNFGLQGD
jgi:hypothetical protein